MGLLCLTASHIQTVGAIEITIFHLNESSCNIGINQDELVNSKHNQEKCKMQDNECLKKLHSIKKIIFELNEINVVESVELLFNFYDENFPYSFNLVICRLLYICFTIKMQNVDIYLKFIKLHEKQKEEKSKNSNFHKVTNIFEHFLILTETQESNYLLEKLIGQNFIEPKSVKNKHTLYFSHYKTEVKRNYDLEFSEQFFNNIEELKKDEWNLHKKYVQSGVNPLEIAKVIRKDEVDQLQKIASQTNYDFNNYVRFMFKINIFDLNYLNSS